MVWIRGVRSCRVWQSNPRGERSQCGFEGALFGRQSNVMSKWWYWVWLDRFASSGNEVDLRVERERGT